MKPSFAEFLVCPYTHQPLTVEILTSGEDGRVKEGWLVTPDGKNRYRIRNHIPRFVGGDAYVGNFSFEWKVFKKVLFNEEHLRSLPRLFCERYLLRPERFPGATVLDVGCGAGRFSHMAHQWGAAQVVGIDLSNSVDFAQQNVGVKDRIDFVQADVYHLPFRPGVFDIIYSIGVLHHTPDPCSAFMALPPLLKQGGQITVGLYTANWGKGDVFLRRFTPHLPKRLLYALSHLAIPLYHLYRKFPTLYQYAPIYMSDKPDERVLNTFDWYSPRYQHYVRTRTIAQWFFEAGLRNVRTPAVPADGHVSGDK